MTHWVSAGVMCLQEQTGSPTGGLLSMLFPLVMFVAIFYFLLFRPMKKKQKQHDSLLSGLKSGDRVITSGGIYGTVDRVKDKSLILKIGENVKIEVSRASVAGLQSDPPEETK